MIRLADLTEKKTRTVYKKDIHGNRKKITEEYTAKRLVETINAWPRFGHFIIDSIIINILYAGLEYAFLGIWWLFDAYDIAFIFFSQAYGLLFFFSGFYYFIFEWKWGKTPGKYVTKSIAVDEYGNPLELRHAAIRALVRYLPFEAFTCIGSPSYGWHDKFAETYVIKESELSILKKLQEEQSLKIKNNEE